MKKLLFATILITGFSTFASELNEKPSYYLTEVAAKENVDVSAFIFSVYGDTEININIEKENCNIKNPSIVKDLELELRNSINDSLSKTLKKLDLKNKTQKLTNINYQKDFFRIEKLADGDATFEVSYPNKITANTLYDNENMDFEFHFRNHRKTKFFAKAYFSEEVQKINSLGIKETLNSSNCNIKLSDTKMMSFGLLNATKNIQLKH